MRTLTSVLLALTVSFPVNAQEPPERRGFWIGFGLGGGTNLTTALDDGSPAGFSGNFRLGGTLSPKWLLGAESAGWIRDVDLDVWAYRTNFTAIVLFYPSASGGLFLKAGPGVSMLMEVSSTTVRIDGVDVTESVSATEMGFGGTFGVGYDLKIGRNLYLVPEITWLLQGFEGRTTETPLGTIPSTNSLLLFTLGLTWH